MRPFEFKLPPEPERSHPAWGFVSVLVHAVVIGIVVLFLARTEIVTRTTTTLIQLLDKPEPEDLAVEMPPYVEQGEEEPEPVELLPREPEPEPQVVVEEEAPPTDRIGRVETVAAPTEVPERPDETEDGPTPVIGQRRLLGPAYAGGRVWVQPMEAELGVVEASPDRETHAARVAAAVTALVRAYADTMPADSFATPGPPKWTSTDSEGKTWGVDQQWLYLGDIKIPTLLLALLNLPQGNYYQAREEQNLRRIRADIMQAADRIETVESINEYVKEIRRRKDAERALLRAAVSASEAAKKGTSPDTTSRR